MKCSKAQRDKVRGQKCIVCLKTPVDPAHMIDRSIGGCNAAECVVPLCRFHHRKYDEERFDLLPYLDPLYRKELAHGVMHVGLLRTYARVTNQRTKNVDEQFE